VPKQKQTKNKLEEIEKSLKEYDDVRVAVYTQPKLTSIGKKKPELFELCIGTDNIEEKFKIIKEKLNQEIQITDVFQEGQQADIKAITIGKGTQGPVKRFGISLRFHKAEKGVRKEDYRASRLDVFIGCGITEVIAFFIIVTCATILFSQGIRINEASEAALALKPFAGNYAFFIFAVSLANASLLGAIIVPIATSYYICEGMGWERGVNKTFKEAPEFMGIYTFMIGTAALLILMPGAPLVLLMVLSSVVNGLLLPFVLIYAISLVNNKKLMGNFTNSKIYNIIAWGTIGILTVLTIFFVATIVFPLGT